MKLTCTFLAIAGNSSAVKVIACDAADNDGTWCCAYDGNCCSSSTSQATAASSNHKIAMIVGASVGITLGLLASVGLIIFVTERTKRKRMEKDTTWDRLKTVTMVSPPAMRQQPLPPPWHAPTGAPVYVRHYEL